MLTLKGNSFLFWNNQTPVNIGNGMSNRAARKLKTTKANTAFLKDFKRTHLLKT